MSPPAVLSITDNTTPAASVPNLLPCRIQYDGHIDQTGSYWTPHMTEGTAKEASFRGRRLKGKKLSLPKQYEGVVLQRAAPVKTDNKDGVHPTTVSKEEEPDCSPATQSLQITSRFEDIVIWTQDFSESDPSDTYARSLDEWLKTARQIHSY